MMRRSFLLGLGLLFGLVSIASGASLRGARSQNAKAAAKADGPDVPMEVWKGYNRYYANQYFERWNHWSTVPGNPGAQSNQGSPMLGIWWTGAHAAGHTWMPPGIPGDATVRANGGIPLVPYQPYHVKPERNPGVNGQHLPHDFPAPPGR